MRFYTILSRNYSGFFNQMQTLTISQIGFSQSNVQSENTAF